MPHNNDLGWFLGDDDEIPEEDIIAGQLERAAGIERDAEMIEQGNLRRSSGRSSQELREQAAEIRRWADGMRALNEEMLRLLTPPQRTPEEREKLKCEYAKALKESLRELRRHGKPDPRFAESPVQRVTGEEKLWRIYVRPGVSSGFTFDRATPKWLKEAEPGASVYDVWARSKKQARLLVKLDVWAKGSRQPGIRALEQVPS